MKRPTSTRRWFSGASGNIGQAAVARSKPDGYTFIVTTPGPAADNVQTFKLLPYHPLTDFSFIALANCDPGVLVVRKNLPVNTLRRAGRPSRSRAAAGAHAGNDRPGRQG
jgi:tripartite-type tricarboxylate transporter receptor subunit TctC